jgi:hypothetical protein
LRQQGQQFGFALGQRVGAVAQDVGLSVVVHGVINGVKMGSDTIFSCAAAGRGSRSGEGVS